MVCKPKDEDNLVCNESPLLLHLISLHNPNFLHVHLQIQPKAAWTKVCKPKDEDDFSVVKNSLLQHRAVGSRQDLGVRRIRSASAYDKRSHAFQILLHGSTSFSNIFLYTFFSL
jgi:hypothetical protein